jgi:hypothetical protein
MYYAGHEYFVYSRVYVSLPPHVYADLLDSLSSSHIRTLLIRSIGLQLTFACNHHTGRLIVERGCRYCLGRPVNVTQLYTTVRLDLLEELRQAVLRLDTIHTVDGVQVLDKGDLEACCGTLAGRDRGVGKEVLPNLSPS